MSLTWFAVISIVSFLVFLCAGQFFYFPPPIGTLINDPIRRLFNFLFNSFKAAYQKLADKMFAGLEDKEDK